MDKTVIDDKLSCSICYNKFRLPFVFDCGHSFCIACTYQQLQRSRECALCRAPVNKVIANHSLRDLLTDDTTTPTEQEQLWLTALVDRTTTSKTTNKTTMQQVVSTDRPYMVHFGSVYPSGANISLEDLKPLGVSACAMLVVASPFILGYLITGQIPQF